MLMCFPHIDRIILHLNELLKRAYSVAHLRKRSSIDLSATRESGHFATEGFSQNAECHIKFRERDAVPV